MDAPATFSGRLTQFVGRHRVVLLIMAGGLCLRILFFAVGAERIWGPVAMYHQPATACFSNAAVNLVETGTYTSNPKIKDAYFCRVPGYSLFWAAHYIPLGRHGAYRAVAVSQILLDTVSVLFIFLIAFRISKHKTASWIAATLYAIHPFAIVWVTPSLPDTLTMFAMLATVLVILRSSPSSTRAAVLVGVMCGLVALIREYGGAITVVAGGYWFLNRKNLRRFLVQSMVGGVVFLVTYSPWPLRNYINHGEVVLLRPITAGNLIWGRDFMSAYYWMMCWTTNPDPYLMEIARGKGKVKYPSHLFANQKEKELAARLTRLARTCGGSFYRWNPGAKRAANVKSCDTEIIYGYDSLRKSYQRNHTFRFLFEVPVKNLWKIVFKSKLVKQKSQSTGKKMVARLFFIFRTLLVLLGFAGLVMFRKNRNLIALSFFMILIYFFMAFLYRAIQMRYLLQADVLQLIPAAMFLGWLFDHYFRPKEKTEPES